jgi:hypothetical protein
MLYFYAFRSDEREQMKALSNCIKDKQHSSTMQHHIVPHFITVLLK